MLEAGWRSQGARRAHNPEVAGSIPVPAPVSSQLHLFRGIKPLEAGLVWPAMTYVCTVDVRTQNFQPTGDS
jgi:hypothetical protein